MTHAPVAADEVGIMYLLSSPKVHLNYIRGLL